MPYTGFEPQTAVSLAVINCEPALEATPLVTDICLLACPDNVNMRIEVLSVGFRANVLPVDGSAVDVDIEFIDDSDSDSVTDLRENYSLFAANNTVLVYNAVWRGSQILDPGDVINAEFTTDSSITAATGAALIIEYRVLMRS